MKFVSDYGTRIPIHSPQEIIAFRQNRGSGRDFNEYGPIPPDITAKIALVHKIHGYQYEEISLPLLLRASNELLFNYDFKYGYRLRFGPSVFPDSFTEDRNGLNRAIEYIQGLLETFGWVVSFEEDNLWYYLVFAPLLALTPEEVIREREQKAKTIAAGALKTINTGMLANKYDFSLAELGMTDDDTDLPFLFLCIRELKALTPRYKIEFFSPTIFITPTTSP